MDIEDLVREGRRSESCPYFTSRNLVEDAEFIVAPYNYVLDPVIRNSMKLSLHDSVVIIDEAHNVENACREIATRNFKEEEILVVMNELNSLFNLPNAEREVIEAFKSLHEVLRLLGSIIEGKREKLSHADFEKEQNVSRGQEILNIFDTLGCSTDNYTNLMRQISVISEHTLQNLNFQNPEDDEIETNENEEKKSSRLNCLSQHSLSLLESFSMIIDFIFSENCAHLKDYRLVMTRETEKSESSTKWSTSIGFWCMNPSVSFKNMCRGTHSIILTSGTLSPMNSFASELGVEFPHRLETGHVVPRTNIFARVISHGPSGVKLECTYKNTEVFKFQDDLGETLLLALQSCPDGALVFFPSYGLMEKLYLYFKLQLRNLIRLN
jgi:DNA repair helicase Rad3